jgi:hypothetical protein
MLPTAKEALKNTSAQQKQQQQQYNFFIRNFDDSKELNTLINILKIKKLKQNLTELKRPDQSKHFPVYRKGKGKAVPLHAMEALEGRGGIAPTHSRPRH